VAEQGQKEGECTKQAIVQQIDRKEGSPTFGQWRTVSVNPTPEQLARMANGEEVPHEELPVMKYPCKHHAAEAFGRMYATLAAQQLLGLRDAPPVSDFRILELDE
jgi:hypothetical protein